MFFLKKNLNFFKIGRGGRFFHQLSFFHEDVSFPHELTVFLQKSEKLQFWKNDQDLLKMVYFRENDFILLKDILSKTREGKICCCWPAVLFTCLISLEICQETFGNFFLSIWNSIWIEKWLSVCVCVCVCLCACMCFCDYGVGEFTFLKLEWKTWKLNFVNFMFKFFLQSVVTSMGYSFLTHQDGPPIQGQADHTPW